MSDEVNDIDDLFRNKLGEYAEEAPPSAWEAVNHALDRQQATLYKKKYNRLKRAVLLLFFLYIIGGVYIGFDVWHVKLSSNQKQHNTATISSNETNENLINKKDNRANDAAENNHLKKKEKQQQTIVENDSASSSANNNFVFKQQQNEKATEVIKNKYSPLVFPSSSINTQNSKDVIVENKNGAKQKAQVQDEDFDLVQHHVLQDNLLQPFSLQKNKTMDLLTLQETLKNRKPALLSNNKASTIKIKGRTTRGFSLSLFLAPNFSFERIEDDHHRNGLGGTESDTHRDEDNNFSLSGGALLSYDLNTKISFHSGVSVTTFSTSIAPETVYATADNNGQIRYQLNCSLGSAYLSPKGNMPLAAGDSSETSEGTSKLVYINIPAMVSYHISKGRFAILPTAGVGLNMLASGTIKTGLNTTGDNEKITTSISGLKRAYLNGSLGVGVEYKLNSKLSLRLLPNAMFSLTNMNKEMPVKSYQNYMSVEAGVRIKM